jgi:hypothetical protein
LFAACVSAEAATDFTAFDDFGFVSNLPAFEATLGEVTSFVFFPAIGHHLFFGI